MQSVFRSESSAIDVFRVLSQKAAASSFKAAKSQIEPFLAQHYELNPITEQDLKKLANNQKNILTSTVGVLGRFLDHVDSHPFPDEFRAYFREFSQAYAEKMHLKKDDPQVKQMVLSLFCIRVFNPYLLKIGGPGYKNIAKIIQNIAGNITKNHKEPFMDFALNCIKDQQELTMSRMYRLLTEK